MLLGGCTTPPLHRGLTQTQVTALKSAGFQETQQGFEFGSTGPILFDFDRYNLKPDVRRIVERIGRTLHSAGINGYGSMAIRTRKAWTSMTSSCPGGGRRSSP